MRTQTTHFPLNLVLRCAVAVFLALAWSGARAELADDISRVADALAPSDAAVNEVMDDAEDDMPAVTLEEALAGIEALAPAGSDLELGELKQPTAFLKDSPYLKRLLGKVPDYVYDPKRMSDPMLVPWTRAKVLTSELMRIAGQATMDENWDLARDVYGRILRIIQGLENSGISMASMEEVRSTAEQGIVAVAELEDEQADKQGRGQDQKPKLPLWVRSNTNGIIYHAAEPICLVGNFILKVGDLVPRQSINVRVVAITENTVSFEVREQVFEVNIAEKESE